MPGTSELEALGRRDLIEAIHKFDGFPRVAASLGYHYEGRRGRVSSHAATGAFAPKHDSWKALMPRIRQGESDTVELKKSLAEQNEGLQTLAAFASQEGGVLFFGVTPNGKPVGVDIGPNTIDNLAQSIRTKIRPEIAPKICTKPIDGKVLVAAIVESDGQPHLADGRFFKRIGSTTCVGSPAELRQALLRGDR
jgi:Putative DNA-binding domain